MYKSIQQLLITFGLLLPVGVLANESFLSRYSEAFNSDDIQVVFDFENDIFFKTDKHYTNGVRYQRIGRSNLAYGDKGEVFNLGLIGYKQALEKLKEANASVYSFGWQLMNTIYTPEEIDNPPSRIDSLDRPYSGVTLVSAVGVRSFFDESSYRWELGIGCTGQCSGSGWLQKNIHHMIHATHPEGWDTQTDSSFAVQSIFTYRSPVFPFMKYDGAQSGRRFMDVQPYARVELGTIFIRAAAGFELRAGLMFPKYKNIDTGSIPEFIDAGPQERPSCDGWFPCELYAFGRGEAMSVVHNATVEGNIGDDNSFPESRNRVYTSEIGLTMGWGDFQVTYKVCHRSTEIETREFNSDEHSWGGVQFQWKG